jgi:hypothetical protein
LGLQRSAGNRAVSRIISSRTAAAPLVVQRLKIGDTEIKLGVPDDIFPLYERIKKRKLDDAEIRKVFRTDQASLLRIVSLLTQDKNMAFKDLDAFIAGVRVLIRDWGGQKFFYEKPNKAGVIPNLDPVSGQSPDKLIRLYSARPSGDVQSLIRWALRNGIPLEGVKDDPQHGHLVNGGAKPTASAKKEQNTEEHNTGAFRGHLADRLHTLQHLRVKGEGARVICIHLTPAGSDALRARRNEAGAISKGGEGSHPGVIGMKEEDAYVSVALGSAAETWNKALKPHIAKITLEPERPEASPEPGVASEAKQESIEEVPLWVYALGQLVNVSGVGMDCLIRALLAVSTVPTNVNVEAEVATLRGRLVDQGIAVEGEMLDVVDAAGAVLISMLVSRRWLQAARGLVVYTPETGADNPHVVLDGANPVRLWLSGSHFQAIIPAAAAAAAPAAPAAAAAPAPAAAHARRQPASKKSGARK